MVDRIRKLQKELSANEGVLIASGANRFYLSGFNSSAGYVFITSNEAYFLIDFRYFEKAKETVKHLKVILLEKFSENLTLLIKKHNIAEIFLECNETSLNQFKRYKEILPEVSICDSNKIDAVLEDMRSVKDEIELNFIKKAQAITDSTFSYILDRISVGRTEKEIALDMEFFMRKQGSDGVSFDFIVVSGKNSSLPHGVPTDKKIQKGDFVTMDFGAVINGYRSDMTRTVAVGEVTDRQREVYETVLDAQKLALEQISAGMICKDIDRIARDYINNRGFTGCFGHGLGHSVGIEIHENPSFNTRCETVLKSGMIMTVEPGIYLENNFGVRIEDMVFVTANSHENLTNSPKNLIII